MEIKLNLASKPYLNRQRIRFWLLLGCTLLGLVLVLNCTYGSQNWRQLRLLESRFLELGDSLPGVQGSTADYTPERYAAVKSEIALEKEIIAEDQFRWTILLSRFEDLLPVDVSISSIQPAFKEKSVQIACVARDVSAMTEFIDNLLSSEDLNNAYLLRHGEIESELSGLKQKQVGFSLVIKEAF